jgi:hypothetical protein
MNQGLVTNGARVYVCGLASDDIDGAVEDLNALGSDGGEGGAAFGLVDFPPTTIAQLLKFPHPLVIPLVSSSMIASSILCWTKFLDRNRALIEKASRATSQAKTVSQPSPPISEKQKNTSISSSPTPKSVVIPQYPVMSFPLPFQNFKRRFGRRSMRTGLGVFTLILWRTISSPLLCLTCSTLLGSWTSGMVGRDEMREEAWW